MIGGEAAEPSEADSIRAKRANKETAPVSFEVSIETVDAGVPLNRQCGDDQVRQRQGHAFAKQVR